MSDLTRPIIGIENRTAQEVFDIMCDRFRVAERALAERAGEVRVAELVDGLLDLRDLIMRGKRCVTDTGPAVKPVIELASVHILDDAANALEALTTEPAAPEGRQEAVVTEAGIEAAARHITKWLGFSWDGLWGGRVTDEGFPIFMHHSQTGWQFQGGKGDMIDIARTVLKAAIEAGRHD